MLKFMNGNNCVIAIICTRAFYRITQTNTIEQITRTNHRSLEIGIILVFTMNDHPCCIFKVEITDAFDDRQVMISKEVGHCFLKSSIRMIVIKLELRVISSEVFSAIDAIHYLDILTF